MAFEKERIKLRDRLNASMKRTNVIQVVASERNGRRFALASPSKSLLDGEGRIVAAIEEALAPDAKGLTREGGRGEDVDVAWKGRER